MNVIEKQQPTNPDWGQHPRAPPSYTEVTGDQFNQGQAQSYHSQYPQPVIMQQPVMSQPPVVMPVTVQMGQVPVPPGYCTNCRVSLLLLLDNFLSFVYFYYFN